MVPEFVVSATWRQVKPLFLPTQANTESGNLKVGNRKQAGLPGHDARNRYRQVTDRVNYKAIRQNVKCWKELHMRHKKNDPANESFKVQGLNIGAD